MPIVSSEASRVLESNETQGGDIKFFFIGLTNGYGGEFTNVKIFLTLFGVYKEIRWFDIDVFDAMEYNFLLVDGEIKHLESHSYLRLYNFSGIGAPMSYVRNIINCLIPPYGVKTFFAGSCKSCEIKTYN